MTKTRNQFTTEFKQECVHLVLNQSYSVLQAAKAMQVGRSSLQRWLRQYRQEVKYPTSACYFSRTTAYPSAWSANQTTQAR